MTHVAWEGSRYLQSLSAVKFQYWRDHTRSFDAMTTWQHVLARVDALMPTEVPRIAEVGIDWRVTSFTFVIALATSVVFGGWAAWPAALERLAEVLKESLRGSSGRSRMRQGLLVVQSALSMVLLVGAGLLIATLISLMRVDPGFDAEGVVAVRLRRQGTWSNPTLAGRRVEILGIVTDIREMSLRTEPRQTMYVPQAQAPTPLSTLRGTMPVFIATALFAGGDVDRALIDAIRAVDPGIPRPEVFLLDAVVARSLARDRFGATLISALAARALALTAVSTACSLIRSSSGVARSGSGWRSAPAANRSRVS